MLSRLLIFVLITTTIRCNVEETSCPDRSTWVQHICLHMIEIHKHTEQERLRANQSYAEQKCKELKLGSLNWHLPKIDSCTKAKAVHDIWRGRNLWMNESEFVWIGLRRRGNRNDSREDWRKEEFWFWTKDDTPLTNEASGINLWDDDQPRNLGDVGEECVIGKSYEKSEKKRICHHLLFDDVQCENFSDVDFVNDVVCEATAPKSKSSRWWIYILCALLIIVPSTTIGVVFGVCYKTKRRKNRQQQQQQKKKKKKGKNNKSIIEPSFKSESIYDDYSDYCRVNRGAVVANDSIESKRRLAAQQQQPKIVPKQIESMESVEKKEKIVDQATLVKKNGPTPTPKTKIALPASQAPKIAAAKKTTTSTTSATNGDRAKVRAVLHMKIKDDPESHTYSNADHDYS